MIGVTLAIGGGYQYYAELAMESVTKHTGLDCVCISEPKREVEQWALPHLKFDLFDYVEDDDIFFFDADTRMVRDWEVQALAGEKMGVVADFPYSEILKDREQNVPEIPEGEYFNTGMMILNRQAHEPVLRRAREIQENTPFEWTCCYDQSYINKAAHEMRAPLLILPEIYNFVGFGIFRFDNDLPTDEDVCACSRGGRGETTPQGVVALVHARILRATGRCRESC